MRAAWAIPFVAAGLALGCGGGRAQALPRGLAEVAVAPGAAAEEARRAREAATAFDAITAAVCRGLGTVEERAGCYAWAARRAGLGAGWERGSMGRDGR